MRIKSISYRRILNSHAEFTNEFIAELDDGSIGIGAAPQGETISIYEDKKTIIEPETIIQALEEDHVLDVDQTQETFDKYLETISPRFGQNNSYALSLAFFNARKEAETVFKLFDKQESPLAAPALCLNILNGGYHAYTNPVLSDFSEVLLVSRVKDVEGMIHDHREIQLKVREKLLKQEKIIVNNNPVNRFATLDNRECIEFLLDIRDSLGLSKKYDLMIDASGGDLRDGDGYRLTLTDNQLRSAEEFYGYWMKLIEDYHIGFLEDPFHEKDYENWMRLTTTQDRCKIIGDNFYSSDAGRIADGAKRKCTHGVIVKPNQAGTVTAVTRAIEAARSAKQIVITSHRSISTESTFLATLTCLFDVEYIKIGPLFTDYSSVVRLNEIIRLVGKSK